MAVWTHRAKILHRIHLIIFADISKLHEVVDVNVAATNITVHLAKIEVAYDTRGTIMCFTR
ncbi:hypothetical protein D3C81_1977700 [compost metagenome]